MLSFSDRMEPIIRQGGGASFSTYNPNDCNANVSLSGGNLTATKTDAAVAFTNVRGTGGKWAGKHYFEFTPTYTGTPWMGFANKSDSLTTQPGGAASAGNSVGWQMTGGGGTVRVKNAILGTVILASAKTAAFAVDFVNKRVWVRDVTSGGNWNSSSVANPALGLGGFDFSNVCQGPFFIVAAIQTQNDSIVLNCGQSTFSGSVPNGFMPWRD